MTATPAHQEQRKTHAASYRFPDEIRLADRFGCREMNKR